MIARRLTRVLNAACGEVHPSRPIPVQSTNRSPRLDKIPQRSRRRKGVEGSRSEASKPAKPKHVLYLERGRVHLIVLIEVAEQERSLGPRHLLRFRWQYGIDLGRHRIGTSDLIRDDAIDQPVVYLHVVVEKVGVWHVPGG
jgi:hypothetical protein